MEIKESTLEQLRANTKRRIVVIDYTFADEPQQVACYLPNRMDMLRYNQLQSEAMRHAKVKPQPGKEVDVSFDSGEDMAKFKDAMTEALEAIILDCVVSPNPKDLIDEQYGALESVASELIRLVSGGNAAVQKKTKPSK